MKKVKITVIRKMFDEDLVREYGGAINTFETLFEAGMIGTI